MARAYLASKAFLGRSHQLLNNNTQNDEVIDNLKVSAIVRETRTM